MSDSATLNNAARVLATIAPDMPADAALRKYLLNARHLGPREKRSISLAVFNYFRWLHWLDLRASMQKQVEEAALINQRFLSNPASIKNEAIAARAIPEWIRSEIDFPIESLRHIQHEPTLWLRARPGTAHKLAAILGNCEMADLTSLNIHQSTALKFSGAKDLFLTPSFHEGAFEIQDLASQLVGHACSPFPGQTWWETCAGEGGKTLHLADQMANKGVVWATDRSERRLQMLKKRAARAKIFNFRQALWDGSAKLPTKTKFDGILIDAPCSGAGTWQRNPHARWTASSDDIRELAVVQTQLLNNACGSLKPGGRLVYAVCTLTKSETTAVADAFTAAHPEFEPVPVFPTPAATATGAAATATTPQPAQVHIWPHQFKSNGMFIAAWQKKK